MSDLTKSFSDAFSKKRAAPFNEQHKVQIDALLDFAAALNAQGQFTAEIKGFLSSNDLPVLSIKEKSSGTSQAFFIDFGFEPFGGSATLKLFTGLDRKAVGARKEGYSLQHGNEREELLAAIGAAMAQKCAAHETGAAVLSYANGKKGNAL